jgi:hypothetical protein
MTIAFSCMMYGAVIEKYYPKTFNPTKLKAIWKTGHRVNGLALGVYDNFSTLLDDTITQL